MPKPPFAPPETNIRIPARLEDVRRLTDLVQCQVLAGGGGEAMGTDLELAVAEAANNIILHGYSGRDGEIELSTADEAGMLRIELRDEGAPIPSEALIARSPFDAAAESGRGLTIIRACVDELDYESRDGVNCLTLKKHWA